VARAPPPRTAESVEIAGRVAHPFCRLIQLRPPRSSRFRRPGIPAAATLGFDLLRCRENHPEVTSEPSSSPGKSSFPRPAHVPPTHNPESCSTQIHIPHRIIYAQIPHSQRIMTKSTSQARRFIHNISTCLSSD